MRNKFWGPLPSALNRHVNTFLNSNDSSHLARTSNSFHSLSTKPPLSMLQRNPVKKFLSHVVYGEREQMQEMLQQNRQLLLQRDSITDYSGREFDSISGFEYVLWALDKNLWDDMLDFLPRNEQGYLTEEDRWFVEQLLHQLELVTVQKINYTLNGMPINESHYDFAIISALQEQLNAQNAPGNKNWGAIKQQWRERVGGAQRLMPLHVVDEYCSSTSFHPAPQFDSRPQPANGLRRLLNWRDNVWEFWYGINSKLGSDFAIYKGAGSPALRAPYVRVELVGQDLAAMIKLGEIRQQDFIQLESKLKSLLDMEEQPCPGGI